MLYYTTPYSCSKYVPIEPFYTFYRKDIKFYQDYSPASYFFTPYSNQSLHQVNRIPVLVSTYLNIDIPQNPIQSARAPYVRFLIANGS